MGDERLRVRGQEGNGEVNVQEEDVQGKVQRGRVQRDTGRRSLACQHSVLCPVQVLQREAALSFELTAGGAADRGITVASC